MKELNYKVENAIKQYYEENNLGTPNIKKMSLLDILDAFLMWEGIIGYTHYIMNIIDYKNDEE